MPLSPCPDCGDQISTEAYVCPKCGRPTGRHKTELSRKTKVLLLWVVLIAAFLGIYQYLESTK